MNLAVGGGIATSLTAREAKGPDSDCTTTLVTHTLRAEGHDAGEDGTGRGTPIVVQNGGCFDDGAKGFTIHGSDDCAKVASEADVSQSLRCRAPGTVENRSTTVAVTPVAFAQNQRDEVREMKVAVALAAEPGMKQQTYVCTPIDMRQASRGEKMTNNRTDGGAPGTGIGEEGDPSPTLADSNTPAIAFQTRVARNGRGQPKDVTDALTSSEGGTHADSKPHVAFSGGVRRLMPVECERLQALPDGWTEWGVDENGKRVEMSDSARYRMLGNAVTASVSEWIGRRLMETPS